MTTPEQTFEVVDTLPSNPQEKFFDDLWLRNFESSLSRSNEAVGRVITLGTALAGGSVVWLKEDICYGWWKAIACSLFLIGLAAGVYGGIPVTRREDRDPDIVKKNIEQVTTIKFRRAFVSSVLLILGLVAAVIGVLLKQYHK